ncbi:TetR/AcrR family transcriptional regulator [Chitinophaga ginsengisoli]|uniref:TetR family transcriptional regulator n=1 Tax=Chitinophaga ginsengisoli TaxID=363837 RepID=A0A2P8FGJ9_9BACT|nr:TetR/AcrR family transcriptional regulator [Chitinophaga ginsengisoli]PSL20843.1 TetR family transcriptional regulator [Chitinophaga ginsengisoli]
MGITDRKEREKQEMRKLIIDAAMEMFIKEGFERTSIRNIADKIEYSPATIYLYYKDKDELLYEVQGQAFLELYNAFVKEVTATDPLERLEQLLFSYINFGFEHPDLYDLMFILRAPMKAVDDENDWPNCDEAYNYLADIIDKCGDQLRFDNPQIAALSIWSIGHGLISLYIRERIKVMQLPDDQIRNIIIATAKEHLRLMKK